MTQQWQAIDSGGLATSTNKLCFGQWDPETKAVRKKVYGGEWEDFGKADSAEEAGAKLWNWANKN